MLVDDFLPAYDVSDSVATVAAADVAAAWTALTEVDLIEVGRRKPMVGMLGGLRMLPDLAGEVELCLDDAGLRIRFKAGEGIAGWVASHLQTAIVNDPLTDPRFVANPGMSHQIRAIICVPLYAMSLCAGVFNVHSPSRSFRMSNGPNSSFGSVKRVSRYSNVRPSSRRPSSCTSADFAVPGGPEVDELRFSYFGHQRLYADSREADTAALSYFGLRDRKTNKLSLMRRETRRLQADRLEAVAGETDLLCDDVVRLELSYYDHIKKEWVDSWRTSQADGTPNRLPTRVRVRLIIRDDQGEELAFLTESRLGMFQALDTSPH